MSRDKNIDIESFRRRASFSLSLWFSDLIGRLFHRGWIETDARIESCNKMEVQGGGGTALPGWGGYAVVLSYQVDERRYEAETISMYEAQVNNTIRIRYNPGHPEQNNSFGSETRWASPAVKIGTFLMVFVLLGLLIAGILMR